MIKKLLNTICLLSALFTISSIEANAQDIIHRKNGKKVEAKISEIGVNEIKYKDYNNPDGPTYTIEKALIKQIVFENGKIEKYDQQNQDSENKEWYYDNRKNAIKLSLFGPLRGYSEISYERNIKVGQAYEVSLGFIGLGRNPILHYDWQNNKDIYKNQKGVFVSGGYKFSNMPSFVFFGKPRQKHLFHGSYIKPILYLGMYSENHFVTTDISQVLERQKVTFGNVHIEFGKQWEFANSVVFDLYFGAGYGFDNKKYEFSDGNNPQIAEFANNYTSNRIGRAPGFSMTFGAKFGLLFNTKKDQ